MIRAADIQSPLTAHALASAPVAPAGGARASNWFGAETIGALGSLGVNPRIVGDLSLATRGLSVEQHAHNVLAHLRGDADHGRL